MNKERNFDWKRLRKAVGYTTLIMALGNTPQFIQTVRTPLDELRPTLREQLDYKRSQLRDMSGGGIWINFRVAGMSAGYIVRKYLLSN